MCIYYMCICTYIYICIRVDHRLYYITSSSSRLGASDSPGRCQMRLGGAAPLLLLLLLLIIIIIIINNTNNNNNNTNNNNNNNNINNST